MMFPATAFNVAAEICNVGFGSKADIPHAR
jgi:hypothetical protein